MPHMPNDIQEFIDYGITLLESEKQDEAEAVFLDAQIKWPDDPRPFIGSARTANFNNNLNLSLERWKMARDKFPANLHIIKGLGNVYLDLKEFDKANKCFSVAHELELNSIKEMNNYMGNVNELIYSENFIKAEALLIEAQLKWPEKINPFHSHHRLLEINRRKSKDDKD